jgi:signal transduction histidine kinase
VTCRLSHERSDAGQRYTSHGASRLISLAAAGTEVRSHPIVIGIGAAAVACAALAAAAIQRGQLRTDSPALAAFTIVAGVSFVSAGLIASARRPERWTGALMIAAGFALFAGTLVQANRSLPFTVGLVAAGLPAAVLVNLVLVFPDGRLHSSWERLIVGAAYLNAIVVQIVMLMFMGIGQVGGCPCPHNLLFARDDMTVHMRLMSIERYAGLAIAAAVALVLVQRWRLASPPLRRALFPILVSGGVAIALLAATLIASSLPYTGAPIKLQSAERLAFGVVPIAYLVGLFRARMGRVGVSDLIVELGRGLEPGRLRDAIARSLRDPSLELGFWIRDPDEYVDVDGHPVSVAPAAGRAVTVLERHGRKVAALVHDPALSEDPALLDAVSSAAGLALENERLLAELRAQLDEVRDSRARLVEASVTERRRLERNLHDGAQQRLVTLSLHLRMAQETLHDDPVATEAMLEGVGDDLKQALEELRELARGLHPAVLTDRGLAPALQSLANRSPFTVAIAGVPALRLPEPVEAALYYVVAESLTNAAKHSGATKGSIKLSTTPETVAVEIRDNGSGGANLTSGTGLRGLADRIEALGGKLWLQSPVDGGTVIQAELPLR